MARHPVPVRPFGVAAAAGRVQAEGVDDRQQAPRQAALEDEIEHLEGVGARPLVVVADPHQGA
jgi:hypothetical protein